MITWMQRHKKWLVVTIWISTIAFVGAGFVGWGSYEFGKSEGAVAKVGDREVGIAELQNEYSNLYSQYSRMFGDQFNQEVAKRLNLEDIAFNSIVQKALLLNFADEIGLGVSDEEIAKELLNIQAFQKDGKFDKSVYVQVLNQNRTNPSEFEANLKTDILVQKVRSLFDVDVKKEEIDSFSQLYAMQDDINIEVIEASSILVPNDEAKIKEYWEINKNNYMSNAAFDLETYSHPILPNEYKEEEIKEYYEQNKIDFKQLDGKLKTYEEAKNDVKFALNTKKAKKEALKKYLSLKKGDIEFAKKETIFENELTYSIDDIKDIKSAQNGDILKPFVSGGVYVIVKVVNKIEPKPLAFEKAKNDVVRDYRAKERKAMLISKAEDRLKTFKGTNFKNITLDYDKELLSLNGAQTSTFVNQLFASSKKEGIINLGDKVVLYRVNNSLISPVVENSDRNDQFENLLKNSKTNEVLQNLIEKLQSKYKIVSYMNKGE